MNIKLNSEQAEWLLRLLEVGMDGSFEDDENQRRLCNECIEALNGTK